MTGTLRPCPFCGGKAEYGIVEQGGESNPDFGGHFIQCANEGCGGCMGLRFACGDDPKPGLTAAWNRRAGAIRALAKPNHPPTCECPECWQQMEAGGPK